MKVELYDRIVARQASRRDVLKGTASAVAALGASTMLAGIPGKAHADAHANVREAILKIPGVGKGSPTDADWQKVGALCLGPTKANVAEGEFAGSS